jgi:alpha-galactosidase/6-phospho-beta-glucosidase family protein
VDKAVEKGEVMEAFDRVAKTMATERSQLQSELKKAIGPRAKRAKKIVDALFNDELRSDAVNDETRGLIAALAARIGQVRDPNKPMDPQTVHN